MPIGKMKRLCGWARVPRLNKFLWVFELQLATEIIVFFTMLNKISGIYGILAIFAGAAITLADLILYIYSIFAFVFFLWALEQVRKSRPGGCLLLGYIYLIDMVLNLIFTVHFSVEWFLNPANYILPPAKDVSRCFPNLRNSSIVTNRFCGSNPHSLILRQNLNFEIMMILEILRRGMRSR